MLYIVPTPIGNLEDMTFRAIRVLKEATVVLAEDTRTSRVLCQHYDIDTPLQAYHMHNEHKMLDKYVNQLQSGKDIALISDAGTPAISDPGFLLVREAVKHNIPVQCLPGATAFVPALVVSGIPCTDFRFFGFLPPKKGRQTKINELMEGVSTAVFYESPHKLVKTLSSFKEIDSERSIAVVREISKKFEETIRGSVHEVLSHFSTHPPKGEFVVIVEGKR